MPGRCRTRRRLKASLEPEIGEYRTSGALCAQVADGDSHGYVMEADVARVLAEAKEVNGSARIHIVSALHPTKPFDYYLGVRVRSERAMPTSGTFTPVEIVHLRDDGKERQGRCSRFCRRRDFLRFRAAARRFSQIACARSSVQATAAQWIETMKAAHSLGIRTNATMLYGHVETIEGACSTSSLTRHQDETGGFKRSSPSPFIPRIRSLQ